LFRTCKQQIDGIGCNSHGYITVNDFLDGAKNKIRRSNNKNIEVKDNSARTDIAVFIDYHGNNIRSAGTAALCKNDTNPGAAQYPAQNC